MTLGISTNVNPLFRFGMPGFTQRAKSTWQLTTIENQLLPFQSRVTMSPVDCQVKALFAHVAEDASHQPATPPLNSLSLSQKQPPPQISEMRAARPAADSRDVLRAGRERLEQETWSGAVKKTKRILHFNYFTKSLDAIKCPRYIHPIVLN